MEFMNRARKIELKTPEEIEAMKRAGSLLGEVRDRLGERVRPGITTRQLDMMARRMLEDRQAIPAFLGYQGFPGALCVSVNEEVVHGIPSDRRLEEGDIVSLDIGLIKNGFYSDTARTFPVGQVDKESQRLIEAADRALEIAIPLLEPGKKLGDMAAAVQKYVEGQGFSVVREYSGHGIGRRLHEEPKIPNYGKPGQGPVWRPGMVVAVEPMINAGTHATKVLADHWTVVTADGKRSAHSEHTIAITEDGPVVLT